MKKSNFTEAQIVAILKEGEAGIPAGAGRELPAAVDRRAVARAGQDSHASHIGRTGPCPRQPLPSRAAVRQRVLRPGRHPLGGK